MLWEIAFPLLILFRKIRVPAVLFGAAFHLGVWEFMRIGPPMLMFGYVAFIDWGSLLARFGYRDFNGSSPMDPWRRTKVGGGLVCLFVFLFGAALIDSWPFGVYPTHAGIRGPNYQTVEVVARYPSGRTERIDIRSIAPSSSQTVDFAVLGSASPRTRDAYLIGLASNWQSTTDSTGVELRFYRSVKRLDPDNPLQLPVSQTLLLAVKPDTTVVSTHP
jgi:hypothetical protein